MSFSLIRAVRLSQRLQRQLPLQSPRFPPLVNGISYIDGVNSSLMFSSTSKSEPISTSITETENLIPDSLKEKLMRKQRYESKLRLDAEDRSKVFDSKYSWVLRFLGYYTRESLAIQKAEKLFHTLEVQAQRNGFKRLLCLDPKEETSFQTTQQLLMLHTWMIHKRLLKEGEEGKLVQENLFDNVWEDTRRRIRAVGINELSVNKHLMETQKWSFGSCVTFDHGFEIENDSNEELATALWRAVFQSDSNVPDGKVLQLAKYVRRQMRLLNDLPHEDFLDGRIKWLDPPGTKQEDMLDDSHVRIWRPTHSASGRKYYWNVYTRESRWEPVVENWDSDAAEVNEEKAEI